MAVTTEKSTEYTNATATPVVNNNTTEQHGRVRIAFFTHTQSGAGDATSSVALCKLPPGRVRAGRCRCGKPSDGWDVCFGKQGWRRHPCD